MTILIIGNGQIGNFYLEHYTEIGTPARIATGVDITDFGQVEKAVKEFQPSVVINTAAATSLEWCGLNRTRAFEVNVLGAANVARACDQMGTYLIHFSSGCIFSSADGVDARKEEDRPDPASYYGWTKVWSEELVNFERSGAFECLILRPRQPVSSKVNHKNMLVKMLTFSKFVDTPNSGTVIEDLVEWTDALIDRRATGVFHVANEGWTQFSTFRSSVQWASRYAATKSGLRPRSEIWRRTLRARVVTYFGRNSIRLPRHLVSELL